MVCAPGEGPTAATPLKLASMGREERRTGPGSFKVLQQTSLESLSLTEGEAQKQRESRMERTTGPESG